MPKNDGAIKAKANKKDEFYTCYDVVEQEMNNYFNYNNDVFKGKTVLLPCDDPAWSEFTRFFVFNFERLGLKKLISTSFANDSKGAIYKPQISWFEDDFPQYDKEKTNSHGKIFTLDEEDIKKGKKVKIDDLQWSYLEGDGDFRSDEVTALRDEADFIITNPPFSQFIEFLTWINEANKKFIILGNNMSIIDKYIFPFVIDNKIWYGPSIHSGDRKFYVPDDYPLEAATCGIEPDGRHFIRVKGVRWFTNVDHGSRHEPLELDTMKNNQRYSHTIYPHYVNYDAIDVSDVSRIPSDYTGVMGVPVTFLDKYCPEQFEIVGLDGGNRGVSYGVSSMLSKEQCDDLYRENKGFRKGKLCFRDNDGKLKIAFSRLLIQNKHPKV